MQCLLGVRLLLLSGILPYIQCITSQSTAAGELRRRGGVVDGGKASIRTGDERRGVHRLSQEKRRLVNGHPRPATRRELQALPEQESSVKQIGKSRIAVYLGRRFLFLSI